LTAGVRIHWLGLWRSRLPELLFLLPAFWLRLAFLTSLPIYYDEAIHISLARIPLFIPKYFDAFVHARWLNVMLLTVFQPLGLESLWLSRAVTVILSLITAAATYYVGKWAGGVKVARLALVIYAVIPFAYFYDRQAMSDPIMAAFGALGFVFALRAAERLRIQDAIIAGLLFALSTLTKFAGGLYLVVPIALALIQPAEKRVRALGFAVVQIVICAALFGSVFYLAFQENGGTSQSVGAQNWCHSPQCTGGFDLNQALTLAQTNISYYASTIVPFYTPVVWLLALLAVALAFRLQNRKVLFLAVPAFLFVLPYIPIADLFPPRYYIHTVLPICVLAAVGFEWVRVHVTPSLRQVTAIVLPVLVFVPAVVLSGWQAINPFTVPLARWEAEQYEAGWPVSTTVPKLVNDLRQIQATTGRRVNVIVDNMTLEMYALWGERLGVVQSLRDVKETQIVPWVAGGDSLCLVQITPKQPLGDEPLGLVVEPVAAYYMDYSENHLDQYIGPSTATLLCTVGVTDALSNTISTHAFGDPAAASDAYTSAAETLRDVSGPILLYPSNQVDILKSQVGMNDANLQPLTWPVRLETVDAEINEATRDADDVWAVFAFEDRNATSQQVQAELYSTLYRYEPQYIGPLKLVHYKVGEAAAKPIGAAFSETIELASAAVLEPVGDALCISLDWRSLQATPVSYKIFTHVFDETGQLVAQRDDYPHADLTPTNTWTVGQAITDRFVVTLPAGLGAGRYGVRVGLYDPASGERLITPDGVDSVIVGEFVVGN
jgi:4-amino-4-deoxy-L-arabinose transferase-like glycosyltransferase